MIVFRVLGRIILILGFLVLGLGLLSWLRGIDVLKPAGFVIADWNRPLLNATQAGTERYLHPFLWQDVAVPLLLRPWWEVITILFLTCLVLGGLIVWAARGDRPNRRRRKGEFG